MRDVVIVGTDTDAGKTTFSLLLLAAFPDRFAYWKPVETGDSDTQKIRSLIPAATVFDPLARFVEPVAPPLAARLAGQPMPTPRDVAARVPDSSLPLIIETFGGPLSPFTDEELQVELLKRLDRPIWLVGSSKVGAIGRMLQSRAALQSHGLDANAVILIGEPDAYAEEQIRKHWPGVDVVSLRAPSEWTIEGVRKVATEQRPILERLFPLYSVSADAIPRDFLASDRTAVWHPYTSLGDPIDPLPVVGAEREFLHLADGRRIIDAVSSWWTILHGHRHPPLMQALRDGTRELDHVLFAGVTHPAAVEFAEHLLSTMPWAGGKVFYSDNGSTAVEVALKLAFQFHCHRGDNSRTLFVGFDGGYHGDTFGPMAIGRDPVFFGRFEPFLFRAARVPVSAERLDEFLTTHAHEVAGVILEPLVQGAGGMLMHSPGELKAIFDVARRHGVLFIADEVMTAHRTGTVWAFEQAGIAPDLVCAGKTLTGGVLPLSVTLVSPSIVKEFETPDRTKTFFHGHSFTANPLACAVAVANAKLIRSGEWKTESERIERFWRTRLMELLDRPKVKDVRIRGTIAAVEIDVAGGYLAVVGPAIRKKAIELGVLLRPLGNVVYAMPPLCTSDESLDRIAVAMESVVD
ncbi:MAG: adenosylmethionine--8-amino-7-oxononanoate transaminase [Gemmataceae bacterium]|nr:adenosylmethionine--8-amino-7-oxononanoate transaminase [Gemmataceae bacterium]